MSEMAGSLGLILRVWEEKEARRFTDTSKQSVRKLDNVQRLAIKLPPFLPVNQSHSCFSCLCLYLGSMNLPRD